MIVTFVTCQEFASQSHLHHHGGGAGTKKVKHSPLHPLNRLKELTNYTRQWITENMDKHFHDETQKKWQRPWSHLLKISGVIHFRC